MSVDVLETVTESERAGSGNRVRSRWMRTAVAGVAAATVLSGCGGSSGSSVPTSQSASSGTASSGSPAAPGQDSVACAQVNSVKFDKTKFVLHAGLAFGAFHHFVYQPAKAKQLHGVIALGKAALATAFTVHELKLAKADAESSPTMCKLIAPFDSAATKLTALTGKIKDGKVSTSDLDPVNSDLNSAQNQAKAGGVAAPDVVPSASQLKSG